MPRKPPLASRCADRELRAVDVLVDRASGDEIWQVLDYAEREAVPIAEAYRTLIGDLPAEG